MNKLILSTISCVCFSSLIAQNVQRCGTPAPSAQWDEMFNSMVTTFKTQRANERTTSTATYTIPVIVHVIHGGQAVGTYPNLSASQINSQITVLNQDFGGTGLGVSSYTALSSGGNGPFYDYAQANALPAPDNTTAGVTVSNTGVTFVAATKDPYGNILPEPGIDRVDYTARGWNNPTSYTTAITLQTYIDGTVKPATIWDVTKYYNVWISDQAASEPLIEYVTFPAGTSLTGLSSGAGTDTTDGSYTYSKMYGSITIEPNGTYDATLKYGRTLTHSAGHYLGLRHTWGDGGSCPATTDYCNDTPPQATVNYYGSYTSNTTFIYPCNTNTCSNTGSYASDNGDGIMYMNFMNYSNDAFMCLFTNDQATRMQAALTQSPDRNGLTASALAMAIVSTPTAAFSAPSIICLNPTAVVTYTDASTGNPTSWQWTVSPATNVSPTTSSLQNPTFTFTSAGNYSVSLKVTNASGSDSVTNTITVAAPPTLFITASSYTVCNAQIDTLKATGALTYTWVPGGSNLNPHIITASLPGTYSVIGTDANGCSGLDSITIVVNPNPIASYTLVADLAPHVWDITPGITGGATPYGYLWSWGDGTTDNVEYTSHTYTAAAHYNVCLTVTDANGCANTYCENDSLYRTTQNSNIVAQVNVVGNGTTGINKVPVNRSTIYPNPANNQLNINFASAVNKASIKIYSLIGTEVLSATTNGTNVMLDISNLAAGTYIIQITGDNIAETKKIVKQ